MFNKLNLKCLNAFKMQEIVISGEIEFALAMIAKTGYNPLAQPPRGDLSPSGRQSPTSLPPTRSPSPLPSSSSPSSAVTLSSVSISGVDGSPTTFAARRRSSILNEQLSSSSPTDSKPAFQSGSSRALSSFSNRNATQIPSPTRPLFSFGELSRSLSFQDRECRAGDLLYYLHVEVDCCTQLAKSDAFTLSDPFVVCLLNMVEFGRTAAISDTLKPSWEKEVFEVPVFELTFPVSGGGEVILIEGKRRGQNLEDCVQHTLAVRGTVGEHTATFTQKLYCNICKGSGTLDSRIT